LIQAVLNYKRKPSEHLWGGHTVAAAAATTATAVSTQL